MTEPHELTFDVADDVLKALQRGKLDLRSLPEIIVAHEIGPFLELLYALGITHNRAIVPSIVPTGSSLTAFARALATNCTDWAPGGDCRVGFYRTLHREAERDADRHTLFGLRAQAAAEASGFGKRTAQGFVGAMFEIEDNIFEHSDAYSTGLVAFQGCKGAFTFVVGDTGLGVLDTLRETSRYRSLTDHGNAIRLALQDGVSRFSDTDPNRGRGFHNLFVGLASLRGQLRFVSGDHAQLIEGKEPTLASYRLIQKPAWTGFMASVTCHI